MKAWFCSFDTFFRGGLKKKIYWLKAIIMITIKIAMEALCILISEHSRTFHVQCRTSDRVFEWGSYGGGVTVKHNKIRKLNKKASVGSVIN